MAVKEVRKEEINRNELDKFLEEAELMQQMQPHPNVVLFLGVCVSPVSFQFEFLLIY